MADSEVDDRCIELVAEVFSAYGHPLRLKIIRELKEHDLNVTELTEKLGCSQANISKHLKVLLGNKIVKKKQEGTQNIYSLASDEILSICSCVCDYIKKSRDKEKQMFENFEEKVLG